MEVSEIMRPLQPEGLRCSLEIDRAEDPDPSRPPPQGRPSASHLGPPGAVGIVVRVVTDCSWVNAEELLDRKVATCGANGNDWT